VYFVQIDKLADLERHLNELGLKFRIRRSRLVQHLGVDRVAIEIPDGRDCEVRQAVLDADPTAH